MNVLVIPEDFRKDQFILQPILSAMFTWLGKPAIVEVLKDPLIRGIDQALDRGRLTEIVEANRWKVDLFLLCVDRDGEIRRREALSRLEDHFASHLGEGRWFAAENAWQELEVWVIAGHDRPADWTWQGIRGERDPKETFFLRLVGARNLQDEPGGGRRTLATEAARRYRRIRTLCREDVQVLERRLDAWLNQHVALPWDEAFRMVS
jgi:hypothetical protein